jgi:hypothetical protein
MDMSGQHVPLDNLTLFLSGQRMENRAPLPADLAIQLAAAPFLDKHYVLLAVPSRIRQVLLSVFLSPERRDYAAS